MFVDTQLKIVFNLIFITCPILINNLLSIWGVNGGQQIFYLFLCKLILKHLLACMVRDEPRKVLYLIEVPNHMTTLFRTRIFEPIYDVGCWFDLR